MRDLDDEVTDEPEAPLPPVKPDGIDVTTGYKKAIDTSHQAHYNKTKAEIDAENKHILETKKKCLDWVIWLS